MSTLAMGSGFVYLSDIEIFMKQKYSRNVISGLQF